MNLSKIDLAAAAEAGATLTLRHPITGDVFDPPVTITVLGLESKKFRQVADRFMRSRPKKRDMAPAEAQRFSCELLANLTTGWEGLEWGDEDQPLAFSFDNALMLYTERPWVRQQVDEFVGDAGNFYQET